MTEKERAAHKLGNMVKPMTEAERAARKPGKMVTREQLALRIRQELFPITLRSIAAWPVPYRIAGRHALYNELEALEYARQLIREARAQRYEPRQLADKLVLAELARRAVAGV